MLRTKEIFIFSCGRNRVKRNVLWLCRRYILHGIYYYWSLSFVTHILLALLNLLFTLFWFSLLFFLLSGMYLLLLFLFQKEVVVSSCSALCFYCSILFVVFLVWEVVDALYSLIAVIIMICGQPFYFGSLNQCLLYLLPRAFISVISFYSPCRIMTAYDT